MKKNLLKHLIAATALSVAWAAPATAASEIPCDTARLIVPWGAGGGTDVIFRIFVNAVNESGTKPQLQVVNIGGQGGNKGAKEAKGAKPDGCTLFAIHQSALTSFFIGRVDFTWDAFEPVSKLTSTPAIVGANKNTPFSTLNEMVEAAKAKPGEILTGGTLGSTSHFLFLLIEDAAGIKLKHINYDGTRERMTALLANNIEIGEINLAAAKKYITTGELKALGISTKERNPDIPDVATLQEQGLDLIYSTDRGVMAPKGTPEDIVAHWDAAFAQAAADPAVIQALQEKGTTVNYADHKAYRQYFEETFENWKRIATEVGLYKGS